MLSSLSMLAGIAPGEGRAGILIGARDGKEGKGVVEGISNDPPIGCKSLSVNY